MPKPFFMGAAAICLIASTSYSDPLEYRFGPDKQRGYRPERLADQPPSAGDGFSRRDLAESSSRLRQGVWRRWYYKSLHNLLSDE